MRYLKITWRNSYDLGNIRYKNGFTNVIYLDVEVDRPDYRTTIETELDGDNRELTTFRKWEKAYKFETWATEDLADAFTLMQIHDDITVTLQTGETIIVDQLRVDTSWEDCLCKMTVTFTEDYIIGTNCDQNMDDECLCVDTGEFTGFLDDTLRPTTSGTGGDTAVFYTDYEAGKWYTGEIYELGTTGFYDWVLQETLQDECFDDTTLAVGTWIYDEGTFKRMPGYIETATQTGVDTYELEGWTVPGAWFEVKADDGGGEQSLGVFTEWPVEVDLPGSGIWDVWLDVKNHSCDYGESDSEEINHAP